MKKFLIMLLALVLCLSMVACTVDKKDKDDDSSAADSSASSDNSSAVPSASSDVSADDSVPDISIPDFSVPEFSVPDAPSIKDPDTSAPEDDEPNASTIAGKYMIYHMNYGEMELDYDLIVAAGVSDSYLEIKEDNTVTVQLTGENPYTGTIDTDAKTITVNGDAVSYTTDGETITLTIETVVMTFTKGERVESGKPEAGTDSDGKLEIGKYNIYALEANGMYIDDVALLEAAGADKAYLEIKAGGALTISLDGTTAIDGTYDEAAKTITFSDTATYEFVGENDIKVIIPGGASIYFKL